MTLALLDRGGPKHRHAEGDHQVYIQPVTGERFLSVTSALDGREGEELAKRWRPGLAAKAAFAELPRVVAASRIKPCGRTNSRCEHDHTVRCDNCGCGDCRDCMIKWLTYRHYAESGRRAQEGSEFHDWAEDWVKFGGRSKDVRPEVRPYCDSFLQFVADMGLTPDSWELVETTVLNRAHGWGGTLDAHIRFDATATPKAYKLCQRYGLARPLVTTDYKSRERETAAFFSNMAKQLAAYERGEVILFDDGREEPLPRTDGSLVIQFRPNGYGFRRPVTSDETYAEFLRNLGSLRWDIEHGDRSTQVQAFPDLPIPGVEPPKSSRARKTTAPAAAKPKAATKTAPRPATRAARPAAAAPAAGTRALLAQGAARTADRFGSPLDQQPAHPESPYGDSIPF
jgi:hypothetical protein